MASVWSALRVRPAMEVWRECACVGRLSCFSEWSSGCGMDCQGPLVSC